MPPCEEEHVQGWIWEYLPKIPFDNELRTYQDMYVFWAQDIWLYTNLLD